MVLMLIAIKPDNFIADACLRLAFAEGESTLSGLFPEVFLIMVSLCDRCEQLVKALC